MMNPAPAITIRPASAEDAAACAAIYSHYVLRTACTFEDVPPPAAEFVARINHSKLFLCAVDVEGKGEVCGYAYADIWRTRCGYRFVVETSVYVDAAKTGHGAGKMLMSSLLSQLAKTSARSAVATIALPNPASIKLHENLGFVKCGRLPAIGWKFDAAHDVGFWLYKFDNDPNPSSGGEN